MALLQSEIQRIRAELGYNVLGIGAEPYIQYHAIFDQVIRAYLNAGATTIGLSYVEASVEPYEIELASADGITQGMAVIVDVDERQERVTVQSISAPNKITAVFRKDHTSPFPVTAEGGETIVRDILRKIMTVDNAQMGALDTAGIKSLDKGDVVFQTSARSGAGTVFAEASEQREYWRLYLSDVLNVPYLRAIKRGGGGCYEAY